MLLRAHTRIQKILMRDSAKDRGRVKATSETGPCMHTGSPCMRTGSKTETFAYGETHYA
jgi:hypothetical protein